MITLKFERCFGFLTRVVAHKMYHLPDELIHHICSFISLRDIPKVKKVNRAFRRGCGILCQDKHQALIKSIETNKYDNEYSIKEVEPQVFAIESQGNVLARFEYNCNMKYYDPIIFETDEWIHIFSRLLKHASTLYDFRIDFEEIIIYKSNVFVYMRKGRLSDLCRYVGVKDERPHSLEDMGI